MTWEPADALRRIAFLLERSRAGTYRVKAFRGAAATAAATDPEELRARARAGTLSDLPGIGSATEAVIREALAGADAPAYLASLEEKAAGPLAEGGDTLRAALRGDLHCHSDWSDGGSPIQEMVADRRRARPRLPRPHRPLPPAQGGQRALGGAADRGSSGWSTSIDEALPDFRLLKGIEVDILDDGGLDQTPEMLARLDVVVASVHSKLRMASAPMTRRMVAAVSNPRTNVLGHCTGRLVEGDRGTRDQSAFDAAEVFAACAEHDVAVEINSRPERSRPAGRAGRAGTGGRLPVLHRQRRPRAGPAGLPGLRLRPRRARSASRPSGSSTPGTLDRLLAWARPA